MIKQIILSTTLILSLLAGTALAEHGGGHYNAPHPNYGNHYRHDEWRGHNSGFGFGLYLGGSPGYYPYPYPYPYYNPYYPYGYYQPAPAYPNGGVYFRFGR